MGVIRGIIKHTIVLCVDKKDRSLALQTLLAKRGFKVVVTLNLYEAISAIAQEMPHLVIADSLVADGTAGTLFDRLAQHSMLQATPVLVLVAKKTADYLTPLKGRQFAGFLLGDLDPKILLSKVAEILAAHGNTSPYFIDTQSASVNDGLTISVAASVLGVSDEQAVCRSAMEVDGSANLVGVPIDPKLSPVLLAGGSNLVQGDSLCNLFPLGRARGKGRKWLAELPKLDRLDAGAAPSEEMHRVVFFDTNEQRYQQFAQVLRGYQIDLIHAATLPAATSFVERDAANVACIYLNELPPGTSGTAFKEALAKLSANVRPPVIVATSSLNAKGTPDMRYIRKPFGLGALVEMMTACFKKPEEIRAAVEGGHELGNITIQYQAPARLLGLDESGGVIQLKFPVTRGSKILLNSTILTKLWDGNVEVIVAESIQDPEKPDIWQVRIIPRAADGSKSKYWSRVSKLLKELIENSDPSSAA